MTKNVPVTVRKMQDMLQSDHEHKKMRLASDIAQDRGEQRLLKNLQYKMNKSLMEGMQEKNKKILKESKAEEVVLFEGDGNTAAADDDITFWADEDGKLGEQSNAEPVNPLAELQRLVKSDLILNRQIAARNVLDTLDEVASNEDDLHTLVSYIGYLADDPEFVVRVETLAQVPQIAVFCREHTNNLESVIRQNLVPLTVRRLADHQNQVRTTSQQSLLTLLEKGMIDNCQLMEWICPLVIQLSGNADEEVKTESITFMCKMAPLVGKEITTKFFLEHIASFCADSSFQVRQVCSLFFGDVCKVVGTEATENILLQKFLDLCGDSVWGVRQNCADVFMDVSSVATRETRNEVLANAFVTLLCDGSRWVQLAAYQALGAVISTFADPSKTGLKYCEDGTIVEIAATNESPRVVERTSAEDSETLAMDTKLPVVQDASLECPPSNLDHKDFISRNGSFTLSSDDRSNLNQTMPSRTKNSCDKSFSSGPQILSSIVDCDISCDAASSNNQSDLESWTCEDEMPDQQTETAAGDSIAACQKQSVEDQNSRHIDLQGTAQGSFRTGPPLSRQRKGSSSDSPLTVVAKDGHLHLHVENENNFNNFQFWRVPIPDVELDIDIKDGKSTSIRIRAKVHDEKSDKICASDLSVQIAPKEESCTDSGNVDAAHTSAGKLDIQSACTNMVIDEETSHRGGILVVNSSFSEASVVLNQEKLSGLKVHNRLLLEDYDSIFQSRCRLGFVDNSLVECDKSPYEQDIVPPRLLEYFVGMVDSIQSQTVDVEITRLCARSFPAVAYTLGRKHWPCIKRLCDALAKDMQWKVRKTIAACLHELGRMLGPEITTMDLLPVFASFLKDLDEVRIVVLSHLPEFLKLLKPSERREFLPLTEEFVKMDNERNWRYRCVLAQQLGLIVDLFSPSDVKDRVAPIGMWLLTDKVSEVRLTAAKMMAMVLRRLSQTEAAQMAVDYVADIGLKFTKAPKWQVRQMYVLLCEQLALGKSLPHEVYAKEVLPNFLNLIWDSVPNVRIAVARCFAQTLIPLEYLPTIQRMHYQLLLQVMLALQSDDDRDVQYFANMTSAAFAVLPPDRQ